MDTTHRTPPIGPHPTDSTHRTPPTAPAGGLKIAARRVEDVLHRIPGVFEAAVIALPHPRLGEDVAAVVVRTAPDTTEDPGTTEDIETDEDFIARLQAAAAAVLADYEIPRRVFLTDALPRNPLGKVLKTDLRRQLAGAPEHDRHDLHPSHG